jgi:hypothetical protein
MPESIFPATVFECVRQREMVKPGTVVCGSLNSEYVSIFCEVHGRWCDTWVAYAVDVVNKELHLWRVNRLINFIGKEKI